MRPIFARLPLAALVAFAVVAGVELTARCVGEGSPGITRLLEAISKPERKAKLITETETASPDRNPFNLLDKAQQILPFVGYGFATADVPNQIPRDYFGFRNHIGDSVYTRRTRPLIVMTGNSEMAGLFHPDDMSLLLERELERRGLQFSVLNLAVGGYTLAAEISTYLQFGDRLCPSLVIAHSGGTEYNTAMLAPAKFRQLGLNYHPPMEEWAYRASTLKNYTGPSVWRQHDPNVRIEDVYPVVEMLISQYRSVVERGGHTKFLFGAQKIGEPLWIFPFMTQAVQDQAYAELRASLNRLDVDYLWFSDDPKIKLRDNIHTTPESAQHIVEVYADWIQGHIRELHTDVSNLSKCSWQTSPQLGSASRQSQQTRLSQISSGQ